MPITKTCEVSMKISDQFQKNCKVAKLKSLYKKLTTNSNNFKPISLLLIVSKIIEKLIHVQTINYIMENNVFNRDQFGFRKNHSTDTSFSYLKDNTLIDLDSGLFICKKLLKP